LKRDGTRAETRFGLSAKRTSPFKLAGASVQSTTSNRHVRISGSNGSNAGCTMFRGRLQDYWLPTPLACFPFTSSTVRHRLPAGFNWALLTDVWTYRLSQNFCKYHSMLPDIQEKRSSQALWILLGTPCLMLFILDLFNGILNCQDINQVRQSDCCLLN